MTAALHRFLLVSASLLGVAALPSCAGSEGSDGADDAAAAGKGGRAARHTREDDPWRGYAEALATPEERFRVRLRERPAAGMVFDVRSGRVLWARRPRTRRPIASLTKMMTAIVAADALPPGATVKITREALAYEGSGVGLFRRNQHIDADTMLYGLLLPSGNDVAIALAQRVAGSVRAFVRRMNRRARSLRLSCTRFSSPSGILDRGNFSCARDLARLGREVLRRPLLREIVGTQYAQRRYPSPKRRKLYFANNNTLMRRGYGGVTGVKTGYTDAAGSCLVATVRRGGRHLGVVLLDSPDTGEQGGRLLDEAFRRVLG